jgi:twitching motility two-component system response regulator PilH
MSTIMVVDDSPTIREMISEILIRQGLTVVQASDGFEAKEKILASCPDLVIMDVVMPRMNGYELCRWVKAEPLSANVPVIICTTKSEEFDRHWAMKQKADAYITKPFKASELMIKVRELLKQSV